MAHRVLVWYFSIALFIESALAVEALQTEMRIPPMRARYLSMEKRGGARIVDERFAQLREQRGRSRDVDQIERDSPMWHWSPITSMINMWH
uniref:Uncharacterized protein n=1 Tax=Plectus sambesii TaxID=2011161 RepID=A0A914VEW3_9BILA